MNKKDIIEELSIYICEEGKYRSDIKRFSIITLGSILFSFYLAIFESHTSFGLMFVFILTSGGLMFYLFQLFEKKSLLIKKMDDICIKLYGKIYINSKKEVYKDIQTYIS